MLARLARFCARRTDFTPPDSESADVIDPLQAVSPEQAGLTGQIVFEADQGVDDPVTWVEEVQRFVPRWGVTDRGE